MPDVVETCSRCGKLIEGGPALVVVQSGPRPRRSRSSTSARVRRLDVTVVRPAPPRPAAGARGPTHRTTGRHVASPSRPPSASAAPAVAGEAKEVDPRAVAIAYVFLTFTVLAFVLYQVWKLSLHVF